MQARRKAAKARFGRATARAAALSTMQAAAPALRSATIKRARASAVEQGRRRLADVLRVLLTNLTQGTGDAAQAQGTGDGAQALVDSEMEALQVLSERACCHLDTDVIDA